MPGLPRVQSVVEMAAARWDRYRRKHGKLLRPSWFGDATGEELEVIQNKLREDADLARWRGFKPSMKSRSEAAIVAVAEYGSPEVRATNVMLARRRSARTPTN